MAGGIGLGRSVLLHHCERIGLPHNFRASALFHFSRTARVACCQQQAGRGQALASSRASSTISAPDSVRRGGTMDIDDVVPDAGHAAAADASAALSDAAVGMDVPGLHERGWAVWARIGSPKYVMAPMTEGSDLAFRMLCRQHGATLCYTPMMFAQHFATSARYRNDNYATTAHDRPLAVQFCASDPETFVAAAKMVQADCDMVDLNLDWNQTKAEKGPYGAALQKCWDQAVGIVAGSAGQLEVPVSCKMRLFPTVEESVARAKELEAAGCGLLTVHGRTRAAKGELTGVADWDAIAAIKKVLSIPVLANGSVADAGEADACLKRTAADGVMLGNAFLNNPYTLLRENPSCVAVAQAYLALCREHPVSSLIIRDHLAKLWWRPLLRFPQLRQDLIDAYTLRSFGVVAEDLEALLGAEDSREGGRFPPISQCQPALLRVPAEPTDRAEVRWVRFNGDVDQAKRADDFRQMIREASPLENFDLEWQELMSRKKAKKFVAVSKSHLRSLKRKRQDSGAGASGTVDAPADKQEPKAGRAPKTARSAPRDRKAERQRMVEAQKQGSGALQMALDMGMGDHMSAKELNKLANQVRRLYGVNMTSETPAHVHLTGLAADGRVSSVCRRYCDGFDQYVLTRTPQKHNEYFSPESVVYMTPDSPNALTDLDPTKVYVIGGLVDEHIIKNLTLDAAAEARITTARLPITEHALHQGPHKSQVLACNQVFEILMTYWTTKSWPLALKPVLPVRKGYFVGESNPEENS